MKNGNTIKSDDDLHDPVRLEQIRISQCENRLYALNCYRNAKIREVANEEFLAIESEILECRKRIAEIER